MIDANVPVSPLHPSVAVPRVAAQADPSNTRLVQDTDLQTLHEVLAAQRCDLELLVTMCLPQPGEHVGLGYYYLFETEISQTFAPCCTE